MDENTTESNYSGVDAERSEEELAWDQEFKEGKQMGFVESIADMAKLVVKVPVAILQMPLRIIPEETARHTRAAVRETFMAFRSLLGAAADGIENILADPEPMSGPDGTWGRGPRSGTQTASASATTWTAPATTGGRSKRIALSDDQDAPQPSAGVTSNTTDEDAEAAETRGLRADIDY